jgi:hypothetical protein
MVFLTSSRGGFVGLLAAGMVFVYRRRGLGGALAVMLLLVASVVLLPTDVGTRALATLFQEPRDLPAGLETSNRAHVALFWAALRMIGDNPLLGVGPLNFRTLSSRYTGLDIANIAHTTFLGPPARAIAGWAEGLRSGLIGFLVSGCFVSAQYEKILWLTVFLTIALGAIAEHRARLDRTADVEERPPAPALVPAPEAAP